MRNEFSGGVVAYWVRRSDDGPTRMYLLLHYHKGYWDFPKGRLEKGETALEAAHRELYEETGLTAVFHPDFSRDLYYRFKSPDGDLISKTVTYFVGKSDSEVVQISFEHKGHVWLPFKEALQQLTYLNARTILTEADEFLEKEK